MATSVSLPDLDRLRPAGTKRSSKRDQIVNAFLKQEGHLSADDLVDMIKREDQPDQPGHRLPHAAVDGDGGDRPQGRLRRGPLPLRALLPAPAPLPPDLQDLQPLVRVPQLGHRVAGRRGGGGAQVQRPPERRADLRHLRGLPGRTRRRRPRAATPSCCSPATRCASPSPPSAAAASSTPARRGWSRTARGRHVFEKLAEEEVDHLDRLEARYATLLERDPAARVAADVPVLQGRGQRPVRRRHRAADASRASTRPRRCASASAASAARTSSSSATASGSRIPKASRSSSSSPTRSASTSSC